MNIFLFCVKLMFDPHVVKMPLETAQLLYSVWWVNNGSVPTDPDLKPYKCTHKNHPRCGRVQPRTTIFGCARVGAVQGVHVSLPPGAQVPAAH